jgi:transposase-like protein
MSYTSSAPKPPSKRGAAPFYVTAIEVMASQGGISTAPRIADEILRRKLARTVSRHNISSYTSNIMKYAAAEELIEKVGTEPSSNGRGSANIWKLTGKGYQWLAEQRPGTSYPEQVSEMPPREAPADSRRPLPDDDKLKVARELYGPGTPREERQRVARELHGAGHSYSAIARVFGVVPETIRHDVMATEGTPPWSASAPAASPSQRAKAATKQPPATAAEAIAAAARMEPPAEEGPGDAAPGFLIRLQLPAEAMRDLGALAYWSGRPADELVAEMVTDMLSAGTSLDSIVALAESQGPAEGSAASAS